MRRIATLEDEKLAARFGDYLLVQKIENRVDAEDDGSCSVWVHDEDHVETAREMFERFERNPDAAEFAAAGRAAKEIRGEREKERARSRSKVVDVRTTWASRGVSAMGPVTLTLIIASVIVGVLSQLGRDMTILRWLFITEPAGEGYWYYLRRTIEQWQLWRFVTPIFIHFGILHIVFNLWWTKDLAGMIEYQRGSRHLAIFVIVVAVISNYAQYALSGPYFGGMSGIVYALFGYIWIRSRMQPGSGFVMPQSTVVILMLWFFICWFGMFGFSVANVAHTAGLLCGCGAGWLAARWPRR